MAASMTGYGRGAAQSGKGTATVEIKTVNSRFLELNLRSDGVTAGAEETVRRLMKEKVSRGKAYISVKFQPAADSGAVEVAVNRTLLDAYLGALKEVQKRKDVKKQKISVTDLLALPTPWLRAEVAGISEEELIPLVAEATEGAIAALKAMREREGENLTADLTARISFLREKLEILKSVQDRAAQQYGERLRTRIQTLMADTNFQTDEGRILEEIAIYSEKTDYTEEVVRFESHLKQFETALASGKEVGRKLDFLVQELNREINTMGSKANDLDVTDTVIAVKTELEKVREQVQNLE